MLGLLDIFAPLFVRREMKVSVITVTYNSNEFISDCLRSLQSQDYADIEHIVIDGGSVDGTLERLSEHNVDSRTVISEPDLGIYDAMNKGLGVAQGDIIGFLNSDDVYADTDVISRVTELFLAHKNVEACYGDLVYTARSNIDRDIRYWRSGEFRRGSFRSGWCPPHPTFFMRGEVFQSVGRFDISYKLAADFDFMFRALEIEQVSVKYIPKVLVRMRMGGATSRSFRSIWDQNVEIIRVLRSCDRRVNYFLFFVNKIANRINQLAAFRNRRLPGRGIR